MKLNPNIVVALIAGTVTITGYFITRYLENKKIVEQQIREQKLPADEIVFHKTQSGINFSEWGCLLNGCFGYSVDRYDFSILSSERKQQSQKILNLDNKIPKNT